MSKASWIVTILFTNNHAVFCSHIAATKWGDDCLSSYRLFTGGLKGKTNDYLKGQLITLQYIGLHFNQSHSDIKGFMDYCLVAIEEQNMNGLTDAINQAIHITEVLGLDSNPKQIKRVLKEYNQFLSNYPFPAVSK
ncbi:hypothetical protein ACX1C1_20525 [Paenibacillus sp. strain BS8-2]